MLPVWSLMVMWENYMQHLDYNNDMSITPTTLTTITTIKHMHCLAVNSVTGI